LEQWLRRVPDDPGGLLREKFRYQSRQRALEPRRPVPPNNEQQERW
jgi:Ca-activated chloride channel family protein